MQLILTKKIPQLSKEDLPLIWEVEDCFLILIGYKYDLRLIDVNMTDVVNDLKKVWNKTIISLIERLKVSEFCSTELCSFPETAYLKIVEFNSKQHE